MLHWRVGLNPNHMVKGSGTWTAEEDERLSKLVEVVGMKVREGPRGRRAQSTVGLADTRTETQRRLVGSFCHRVNKWVVRSQQKQLCRISPISMRMIYKEITRASRSSGIPLNKEAPLGGAIQNAFHVLMAPPLKHRISNFGTNFCLCSFLCASHLLRGQINFCLFFVPMRRPESRRFIMLCYFASSSLVRRVLVLVIVICAWSTTSSLFTSSYRLDAFLRFA